MRRRRCTREQIRAKLAEGEKMLAWGQDLDHVVLHLGVTVETWYRWRKRYGEIVLWDNRCLSDLKQENLRLKRIVAEQTLDIEILKELNRQLSRSDAGPAGSGSIVPLLTRSYGPGFTTNRP